jgi:hypothetical protein
MLRHFRLCSSMLPCTTQVLMKCFSLHILSMDSGRRSSPSCKLICQIQWTKLLCWPKFSSSLLKELRASQSSGIQQRQQMPSRITISPTAPVHCGRRDNSVTSERLMMSITIVVKSLLLATYRSAQKEPNLK